MNKKTSEVIVLTLVATAAFTALGGGSLIEGLKRTASGIAYLGGGALSATGLVKPKNHSDALKEVCIRIPPTGNLSCGNGTQSIPSAP